MKKTTYYLYMLILSMGFLLTAYSVFLNVYPLEVVRLTQSPIPVEPKHVKAGEKICVHMKFEKLLDYKPEVNYYLLNDSVLELRRSGVSRPVGTNEVSNCFVIPQMAGEGLHLIQVDLAYEITPTRTINYSWITEEFYVEGVGSK